MKSSNEEVRKSIEETAPLFQAVRRADVALQIRSKMHAKGLKNRDIAERLGVSEANVSRWLRGNQNLSVDTIYQLADAIEESVEIIVGTSNAAHTKQEDISLSDNRGGWEELKAATAAVEQQLTAPSHSSKVYDIESYRLLRQANFGGRAFDHSPCEFGISVHEEERAYK